MNSTQWHTMMQGTRARARNTDPIPSDEAAELVDVSALEEVCLRHIRAVEPLGLTSKQLAHSTGLSLVTVSPRLKPLEDKGKLYRAGKRHFQSRVGCTVWRAVPVQEKLL
jgi:hypothetical protein